MNKPLQVTLKQVDDMALMQPRKAIVTGEIDLITEGLVQGSLIYLSSGKVLSVVEEFDTFLLEGN